MPLPSWNDEAVIKQLNSGHIWPGSVITYSFARPWEGANPEQKEYLDFHPLSDLQREYAHLAIATWDELIAPSLTETDSVVTDIEFGNTSMQELAYAHAYFPPIGSIWFAHDAPGLPHPIVGSRGFSTYIHEIGHALGLNHMGSYNGQPGPAPSSVQDSTVLSVMSYLGPHTGHGEGQVIWGKWTPEDGQRPLAPQTPMLNDIMAIQSMYGPADTRPDDTVYGFGSTVQGATARLYDFTVNLHPVLTLYDSGGIDTLDLSGWSSNNFIDLRPGHLSSVNGMTNNLGIARGVTIENVISGPGDDIFFGNAADNWVDGGAGIDHMHYSGAHTHFRFTFDIGDGNYWAHDLTGQEGRDRLANIEFAHFSDLSAKLSDLTSGVHRFFNTKTGSHFYSADNEEAFSLTMRADFIYEGVAFGRAQGHQADGPAIHRYFNEKTGAHFYTTDPFQAGPTTHTEGWVYEGVAFRAFDEESSGHVAVHRFQHLDSGGNFLTASPEELEQVLLLGVYQYEGVAFYAEAV